MTSRTFPRRPSMPTNLDSVESSHFLKADRNLRPEGAHFVVKSLHATSVHSEPTTRDIAKAYHQLILPEKARPDGIHFETKRAGARSFAPHAATEGNSKSKPVGQVAYPEWLGPHFISFGKGSTKATATLPEQAASVASDQSNDRSQVSPAVEGNSSYTETPMASEELATAVIKGKDPMEISEHTRPDGLDFQSNGSPIPKIASDAGMNAQGCKTNLNNLSQSLHMVSSTPRTAAESQIDPFHFPEELRPDGLHFDMKQPRPVRRASVGHAPVQDESAIAQQSLEKIHAWVYPERHQEIVTGRPRGWYGHWQNGTATTTTTTTTTTTSNSRKTISPDLFSVRSEQRHHRPHPIRMEG